MNFCKCFEFYSFCEKFKKVSFHPVIICLDMDDLFISEKNSLFVITSHKHNTQITTETPDKEYLELILSYLQHPELFI